MIRYVIRRLLWAVVLFLAITVLTFLMFYVIPVNPAAMVAGKAATPEEIKHVQHLLYLDQPLWRQYLHFLDELFQHRSLGYSYGTRQSVNTIISAAAPVTASVVIGGAIFWMLVAVPVGIYSALRPRSKGDRVAMVSVLAGISAHPVWVGYMLSLLVGYELNLLPIQGYCNLRGASPGQTCGGPIDWFTHMLLPWITFAILYSAFYVRMIRSSVMETLNEDYVRTARAKGASERRVITRHVLRNAMLPVVTMLGMDIAVALGGAVFVEIVFGFPGLGGRAVQAVGQFDLPTISGTVIFASIMVIAFNLLVDLLYAWIDPRIRLS
ncbi:MAG TPA: ABC transporter permease [Gaiellales bacterium]|jgi:peptide/nickel transport system permease protein